MPHLLLWSFMIFLDGALCATNLFNEYIYISNYLFSAIISLVTFPEKRVLHNVVKEKIDKGLRFSRKRGGGLKIYS